MGISKISDFIYRNKYYIALLVIALLYFHGLIFPSKILSNIHYINDVTFYSYNVKKSLGEWSLPLWTPFYYSGRPLYAQPEYHFIDINFILILITGNIYLAMNYSVILYFFLAGVGMFLLSRYLTNDNNASIIASLIYLFNGYMQTFVLGGNIMVLEGYSTIPFIFLFFIKALKTKELWINSIISGIFVALLVYCGGMIFMPFLLVLALVYSLFFVIAQGFKNRITKLFIVGTIIVAVSFSLSAIKLLPGIEFMKMSNRGEGVPYQEYLGEPITGANLIHVYITNVFWKGVGISSAIGISAFILLIFSLRNFRNKNVVFFLLAAILSFFLSTESFLSRFLFDIPVFNQTRHIERFVFVFAFSASVLVAFGYVELSKKARRVNKHLLLLIIIFLISLEIIFMQPFPKSNDFVNPDSIPILANISKDKEITRTMNIALNDVVGASGYNYYSQKGFSDIKGGGGIWFDDYIEYLIIAENSKAKFWGNLNNKYVISGKKINSSEFSFEGEFEGCNGCSIAEAWGPYLYVNKEYMPRYYLPKNVMLILGSKDNTKKMEYGIMINDLWNAKETALITEEKLDNFGEIKGIKAVLLVSTPSSEDTQKLKDYKESGGIIIPDIFEGKNTVSESDLKGILNESRGFEEVEVQYYGNNKVIIQANKAGWIVASERFADFPGWRAQSNNKDIKIHRANGIISAVYSENPSEIVFTYSPNKYKIGRVLTLVSVSVLLVVFIVLMYKKYGGKNKDKS